MATAHLGPGNLVAERFPSTARTLPEHGPNAILNLRCLSLDERWDEYWQPLDMAS